MTEEQANEIATRLTVALIEAKQLTATGLTTNAHQGKAGNIVALLLSMRDGLLQKSATAP